jgi:hypothetical protein
MGCHSLKVRWVFCAAIVGVDGGGGVSLTERLRNGRQSLSGLAPVSGEAAVRLEPNDSVSVGRGSGAFYRWCEC